jgi:hypothetical protein
MIVGLRHLRPVLAVAAMWPGGILKSGTARCLAGETTFRPNSLSVLTVLFLLVSVHVGNIIIILIKLCMLPSLSPCLAQFCPAHEDCTSLCLTAQLWNCMLLHSH